MKTLKTIALIFVFVSCKAQSPILDISESGSELPNGYYLKDINNLLNQFEGTYLYIDSNTSFKIVLIKKILQYNGKYYEDLIIGEYQYIENGIEKINTLNEINITYSDQAFHKIASNLLVNNNFRLLPCTDCLINEKRLHSLIMDPISKKYADLIMRRTSENNQEIMKIVITQPSAGPYVESEGPGLAFSLPLGQFTLIKQ
jgi:hypothetical protein